jgi:uncharacterized protein (TIRG00374 family)
MRRVLFWLLTAAFIAVIVWQRQELQRLAQTLSTARPGWLLLGLIFSLFFHLAFTKSYQAAFSLAGIHLPFPGMLADLLASIFIGVVSPGAAAAGLAVFIDHAVREGHAMARATLGLLLQLIADFASLALLVSAGLWVTHRLAMANTFTALSAGVLWFIALALVSLAVLGAWKPAWLERLLHAVRWLANRPSAWLHRPEHLPIQWVLYNREEFGLAAAAVLHRPGQLVVSAGWMMLVNLLDIGMLAAAFACFGYHASAAVLLAGFTMMVLATALSPVPQGVGVVEGGMVAVFYALGVPLEINLAAALVYRGLSFWLPMLAGFLFLRKAGIY